MTRLVPGPAYKGTACSRDIHLDDLYAARRSLRRIRDGDLGGRDQQTAAKSGLHCRVERDLRAASEPGFR